MRSTERMTTYALEEGLQYSTSLFVDETGNTLNTTTTSETADSRLGNALDVVTQDFTMAFGTGLSETLATLSTASYKLVLERTNKQVKRLLN